MTKLNGRGAGRQFAAPAGLLCLTLVWLPAAAQATEPLWELGLGAAALRLPHYRGSDQTHQAVFPVPYVIYRGDIFRADRDGARAVLLDTKRASIDLSLSAAPPTRSRDNLARANMASLPATFEFGPKVEVSLAQGVNWKLDFRAPVHAVLTVQRSPRLLGWRVAPHLNLDMPVAGWNLGALVGPMWNSRGVNAQLYEVGPKDATAQRPAWAAPAGFAGWQGTLGASRREGRLWGGVFLRVDSLADAAVAASPLVRSQNQVSAGVALGWVFSQSSQTVERSR